MAKMERSPAIANVLVLIAPIAMGLVLFEVLRLPVKSLLVGALATSALAVILLAYSKAGKLLARNYLLPGVGAYPKAKKFYFAGLMAFLLAMTAWAALAITVSW